MRKAFIKGCFACAVESFPADEQMAIASMGVGFDDDTADLDSLGTLDRAEPQLIIRNPTPAFLALFEGKDVNDSCCLVSLPELTEAQSRMTPRTHSDTLYQFLDSCINYLGIEMSFETLAFGKLAR